jgi:membrane associated rhomboid family serine protease
MATAAPTQTCYRHPNRETGVSCSNCGRPICPDCMTPTPVGMRCPECSRDRTQVRSVRSIGGGEATVTKVLIAINVIAFVAELGTNNSPNGAFERGALFGPLVADGEWWRLVTGGFLHAQGGYGFIHIGFNMYLLWILGQMLEPAVGRLRFLGIYAVGLLAGSAGAIAVSPNAVTVGASGAVFGLMGATFFEMRARGIDPFQSGIGGLILINLVFSFAFSGISIGGHIGGLIGGSLAALALQAADRMRRPELGYVALAGLVAVAAVAGVMLADQGGFSSG